MRSAFESWPASSPRSSSPGDSSSAGYEEDDASTRRVRVVGFPESPNFKMEPTDMSRFGSCTLDERPKRQSSLAQQLALNAFEAEQKPKLRAINTKAKSFTLGIRRTNSTLPAAGVGGHQQPQQQQQQHRNIIVQVGQDSNNNRTSFEFPSTLPSGQGCGSGTYFHNRNSSNSSGSEAMPIPQGLTRAYTAPQPVPELSELSPSLVAIIQGNSSGTKPPLTTVAATTTTPTRGATRKSSASRLLPSPASNQHSPPAAMPPHGSTSASSTSTAAAAAYNSSFQAAAERGALAQVAGLREALRQQQEEVARLQLELAKLAMHQQASRPRCGSADVQMTPVTPDAPDEQSGGGGREHHHHGGNSMSPDEVLDLDSHFEGFAATAAAAAAPLAPQWHYSDVRGGRAWCS